MLLADKPLILGGYWQAVKFYKGRVLRLSILIAVLAILILSTVPSIYLGTAVLKFPPSKTVVSSDAYLPFVEAVNEQELHRKYEKMLTDNIAKGVLSKLKKFSLIDLDNELKKAIAEYEIISRLKQKIKTVLPFMPQQKPKALSSKQLGMLRNNYTLEHIMQSLQLRYSSSQNKVFVDYKDQNSTFTIIIATLAADLYMQNVAQIKLQMFEHVLHQFKQDNEQSYALPNTSDIIGASYQELQILDVERSIEITLQEINKLDKQLKDSRLRWHDLNFIRNQVRKYGLNITPLLKHKQITEHPLIQPFKRNVEIAEMKLSNLVQSHERIPSQVAVAKDELVLQKGILDWELALFSSNIESYLLKAGHEFIQFKEQLKVSQQNIQNLTKFQKELTKIPSNVANHQTHQLEEKLSQIANFAPKLSTNTNILLGNYTNKLVKPNKTLIISLSFFLSILVISMLVLILIRLKTTDRQINQLVTAEKEL
jgi:uncharacterized protein involved in exopolysaccharide biosynthesis